MADVEILVHTSAPSRGQDDTRYRALAQAYLNFVPATRQRLEIENEVLRDEIDAQAESQILEELRDSTQEDPKSWESYQPDEEEEGEDEDHETGESELVPTQPESHGRLSQLKSLESPQLSFKSATNNANSPALRSHVTWTPPFRSRKEEETQKSTDSWQGPPSTIADSQPEYKKGLEVFSSPTRMLELLLQQIDSSDQDSQESHIRLRQQSVEETPSKKHSSQISRSSDVLHLERHTASAQLFHPSPARVRQGDVNPTTASPVLGSPMQSTTSSSRIHQKSTSISSSIPLAPLSNADRHQAELASNLPAVVLEPPTLSSVSNEYIPESRPQRRSARIAGVWQASKTESPLSTLSTERGKADSGHILSSTDVQVHESHKAPYSSSSPMFQGSAMPAGRIPETPYHLTLAKQTPATGLKRSWLGVSLENAHIPTSASSVVEAVSSSLDESSSKRRRTKEQSSDGISSSVIDVMQPTMMPLERVGIERSVSGQSTRSNFATSMAVSGTSSDMKGELVSFIDKLTITPPPPPTSSINITPETFITRPLSDLAKRMPISKLYKPSNQTRDLRPTERGYWLINSQPWPSELRRKCWDCLGNFIAANKAGWGVRCERNNDFTSFRVYCWGILAPYIYLLLFMASENKVRKVEAAWIGGNGEALVKMPLSK
jgi:hypothetical protein